MPCKSCEESARLQQEAMVPREVREGLAVVRKRDALMSFGGLKVPDVRMGDVVRVQLVAAAVPDGRCWDCEDES